MTNSQPKLTWHISEVTPEVTRKASTLQKAIKAVCAIETEDNNSLTNFSYYLAATRQMDYPAKARSAVRNLAVFIDQWQKLDAMEVWRFHQEYLPHNLKQVWDEAFGEAQNLFDLDPVELPDDALTPEQKAEAAEPGSPLASHDESLA